LGPRASAAFLTTIYGAAADVDEQRLPIVYVLSDPTVPDRTAELRAGRTQALLVRLTRDVDSLVRLGATDVIVCCVTLHHVVPRLHPSLRGKVRSLVDAIMREVEGRREPHLLLCTEGARQAGIFEAHELWPRVASRIVWPDEPDQRRVHEMIYDVKVRGASPHHRALVRQLMRSYRTGAVISGCTEMHLVLDAVFVRQPPAVSVVDPLVVFAREMRDAARRGAVDEGVGV
jgi:aspartate racemase